ncbi:MAG: tetraacyldisaccharide 4'-kinase [Candidatus Cloacimonetes bacterium]|nr:tetraacyldisaccharide 4'-kinase [Candidatus Cloacimonadota bacterium]
MGQRIRRFLYRIGIFSQYKSKAKIISVGNLTVGGTGKTPFTIYLTEYLKSKGYKVVVSHRGYKGEYENEVKIISENKEQQVKARYAGDEPQILLRNLAETPIIVGKNRTEVIKLAEKQFQPDFIILDDSFQHLQVAHDYDFIMFKANNPLGNGFVLPAGKLREPVSTLENASCFVFNNWQEGVEIPVQISKFTKPILESRYRIKHFINYSFDLKVFPRALQDKKVVLLSAIGNPGSFENSIRNLDIDFIKHYKFIDHYRFEDKKELNPILQKIDKNEIDYVITTEKDYVKLRNLIDNVAEENKFLYAKLALEIENTEIIDEIIRKEA